MQAKTKGWIIAGSVMLVAGAAATTFLLRKSQEVADELLLPQAQRISADDFKRELSRQAEQDLQQAVQTADQSQSYQDWLRSGYRPSDVFAYLLSLKKTDVLCKSLAKMEDQKLALFDSLISDSNEKLPCEQDLARRLDDYWKAAAKKLDSAQALKQLNFGVETLLLQSMTEGLSPGRFLLTFDGGPHPVYTPQILDVLARTGSQGLKAIFFVDPSSAENHPELLIKIVEQGHWLGFIGEKNQPLEQMASKQALQQILETRDRVSMLANDHMPRLVRLPFQSKTPELEKMMFYESLIPLHWTLDSEDWRITGPSQELQHLEAGLQKSQGGILRLSDRQRSTLIVLPHLLSRLHQQGLKTITLQ